MMRDELKDRAISLLKDTYAIGYEDGVKATNVDCGVVWEDRIEDIKADINHLQTYKLAEDADFLLVELDDVIEVISKHCGGENE